LQQESIFLLLLRMDSGGLSIDSHQAEKPKILLLYTLSYK